LKLNSNKSANAIQNTDVKQQDVNRRTECVCVCGFFLRKIMLAVCIGAVPLLKSTVVNKDTPISQGVTRTL